MSNFNKNFTTTNIIKLALKSKPIDILSKYPVLINVSMSANHIPLLLVLGLLCIRCCVYAEIYVYRDSALNRIGRYEECRAKHGPGLEVDTVGLLQPGEPEDGCSDLIPATQDQLYVILATGNCSHETKVRHAQAAGFDAVIVHNVGSNELILMLYENDTGIEIPAVFVSEATGVALLQAATIPGTFVIINEFIINGDLVLLVLILALLGGFLVLVVVLGSAWVRYLWTLWQRDALHAPLLNSLPKQNSRGS
uniref:Receptor homology region, transmembrane domain-and RING domain-containing protein 2 n=1 Tax=Cacopsylla melanoneura TaxID=428564 RepID=A0A8D8WVE3_9HEMI